MPRTTQPTTSARRLTRTLPLTPLHPDLPPTTTANPAATTSIAMPVATPATTYHVLADRIAAAAKARANRSVSGPLPHNAPSVNPSASRKPVTRKPRGHLRALALAPPDAPLSAIAFVAASLAPSDTTLPHCLSVSCFAPPPSYGFACYWGYHFSKVGALV